MSNPDSLGPYWQEPADVSRRSSRNGRSYEDSYDRGDGDGRPVEGGRGRSNGVPAGDGLRAGNGVPDGYRAGDGYSRDGYGRNGGGRHGNGRPDSYGGPGGPDGYAPGSGRGQDGGNGRGAGRSGGRHGAGSGSSSGGQDLAGPEDPRGARYGGRRSGSGARARSSQVGNDLRSRLGLRAGPDPSTGGRAFTGADGYGGNGYGGNGYGGNGYGGNGSEYGGSGNGGSGNGDVLDYRGPGGSRGATGLRERTAGFTDATRSRGPRRASGYADGSGSGDGRDGGPPGTRRKGSWWRHWTWTKAVLVVAGAGAAMLLLVVAAVVYAYEKTPIPTDVSEAALQQSSTVYFSNGKAEVGTFTADGIDRQMLTSAQIPPLMKNAIIAAEDRHFYTEGGISVTGILRSAYEDVKGGGNLQGGSTLTEEFAKNYYTTIGTSRTVSTKLKEIFVSIKLSHQESKDWILTQYLNTVPFGDNAYGVAAAAQNYFGVPAMKLTTAQAAMLAAMVNEPGFFSPNPSAGAAYTDLVARWHYVLNGMVTDGALSQQQADAQKFPKVAGIQLASGWSGYRGYIMQAVENELQETYGYTEQQIDTDGLKVETTINLSKMKALYRAVNQNLAQMKADGGALPKYAHVGALLEQPRTGNILAFYGGPSFSAKDCLRIKCQYNMAMQSRNQVGSSFKPYVLATAVKEGMDVQNSVINGIEPMCVPPDSQPLTFSTKSTTCPADWFPVNIVGENMGPLTVAKAAALSSDPGFEDLIHRAGTQATVNMAKAFGVNTVESGLQAKVGEVGLALGIASLTVEEQATTFATLAADGEYATPHVIAQITLANGSAVPLKITHREVLTPAQAADVDYALSFDTVYGTADPNGVLDPVRPTIGKTGTTDNAQSAFFIGAIPQYSLAVGMFTNSQNGQAGGESLNGLPSVNGQGGGFGGTWPTTIWRTYMQDEFASLPIDQLPTPDFVGFTRWNQVPPQPKPKPKPTCPQGQRRRFGQCPPTNPGQPIPTPPTPPNPTPSPLPTTPTLPFARRG